MPNSNCGQADHVECFSSGALLKDVFFDSDTAMGVLSHVPGGMTTNPLDFDAAGATRTAANALDGTERLLLHGRCMPTLPGEIDGMDAQVAQFPVAAFKTYTQFGPRDGASRLLSRRRPLRHAVHRTCAQARRAAASRCTRACRSASAATSTRVRATSGRWPGATPT